MINASGAYENSRELSLKYSASFFAYAPRLRITATADAANTAANITYTAVLIYPYDDKREITLFERWITIAGRILDVITLITNSTIPAAKA